VGVVTDYRIITDCSIEGFSNLLINVKVKKVKAENLVPKPSEGAATEDVLHKGLTMLPQPIFDNRALNESFYQALINRFHDSLNLATQSRLGECSYGMVPSPTGVMTAARGHRQAPPFQGGEPMTFMIIAPSRLIAEQLVQEIGIILQRVSTLMAGIGQVGVCIAPSQEAVERSDSSKQSEHSPQVPPRNMACKIFPITSDLDS